MRKYVGILLCLFLFSGLLQADTLKVLQALRITEPIKIDGVLDEVQWYNAPFVDGFTQESPQYGKPSRMRTEVKIVYDDIAVYVSAFMYDSSPDSILHQLGSRDEDDLNADDFYVGFDTYNKRIDAFNFGVNAAGVQFDNRITDETYDAVWQSTVKISDQGWSIEFKIPYSAIRFPENKIQNWNVQFSRLIRRVRERSYWSHTPKEDPNPLKYWGHLEGISEIKSPMRLSLTPYVAGYVESAPVLLPSGGLGHATTYSYNYGADLKIGLDDRYTMDMTLLPDFGQVQSDNKVKNLSYREINYDENRPFFKEGTELFDQNNLFYSRRLGKTPRLFYSVQDSLAPNEHIVGNPDQARLLNATKISGRNNNGLGIGFLNAVANDTYAEVEDSSGKKRNILTEAMSNYNILVFDQQLANNSSIYFINTNVLRGRGWDDANVTGSGFKLYDKHNYIKLTGSGALSQKFNKIDSLPETYENQLGYKYFVGLEKAYGEVKYGLWHEALNDTYDQKDFGYFTINNFRNYSAFVRYNQIEANKRFLFSNTTWNLNYGEHFVTHKRTMAQFSFNTFGITLKHLALFAGGEISPMNNYDYYEPRVAGMYYTTRKYFVAYVGASTDYRKKFAIDPQISYAQFINEGINASYYETQIETRFRISDKMMLFYDFEFNKDLYNEGFANFDSVGNIIFGGRKLQTYQNVLRIQYMFKNDMSLSLRGRHYWNVGQYVKYYTLQADGSLQDNPTYSENNDFNYNALNVDLVFSWQFAPGSQLTLVYKNSIESDDVITVRPKFGPNFSNTIASAQTNSISLKFLYYLDYQALKKRKK